MNILMVGPDPRAKGGMATVLSNFQKYYSHPEHRLFFLSSWSGEQKWRTEWRAFQMIRHIIREEQIDVVHFHVAQKGSFFRKALLARLVPKCCRVIFHMHASQFDVFFQQSSIFIQNQIRKALDRLDRLVVLSDSWADFYKQLTNTAVTVIPNAVKLPEQSIFQLSSKTIVTFGRMGQRKGSYDLLQVAREIEAIFPDVRFVLYGDGEAKQVAAAIHAQQIQNVAIGGWIDTEEQQEVLENALLHFLPSYHEGLPMAILETMAAGIPNLSTRVGGIPEVIQDGENGMLSEPGDVKDMVGKLTSFLKDTRRQKMYSIAARSTIKNQYSLKAYHEKWMDLYNALR
ncbi:glycosyltransferase family 4 protein [Paenilisteria rocourtiae]|uniref:Glycosyltransferase involved in cell wall biosynthesis n=2 Tax=Listeria rocourtiae TaxID=647910 RepID=A0A4R6ZK19_9LIST|nr:glycosyltransferase family 4 protein [Listeria rocourtiae]MBC1604603.1 glycosyltransferase family 4 protein [Listeria rocourtiae]TDR52575.1 glycosyltransferase involved in cell wall biosynthesis [Listeria rocourtiae]